MSRASGEGATCPPVVDEPAISNANDISAWRIAWRALNMIISLDSALWLILLLRRRMDPLAFRKQALLGRISA